MAHVYCCNSTDTGHLSSTTIGILLLKYLYPIIEFLTTFKCISLPNDFVRSGRTVTVRKGTERLFCSGLAGETEKPSSFLLKPSPEP